MRLSQIGVTPKQHRLIALWFQWQLVSWKGLGLLCIPMLFTGMASQFVWSDPGFLNLGLALIVGVSLYGFSVGNQQRQFLSTWFSNVSRWQRSTTKGTLLGSLVACLVSFLGFYLSTTLIVTLILMPLGLLVGLFTPILSGGLGGLILGCNQQKVLSPYLQQAYLWSLWSGLGGLIAGFLGIAGRAILNELVTDFMLIFNPMETMTTAMPVQIAAVSLLIGWAVYQVVTGFAMAWLLETQTSTSV